MTTTNTAAESLSDRLIDDTSPHADAAPSEAKRGTDAQILFERKLTCEAINGAMAFGYQNTNPPPSDEHWLAPFWNLGRMQAEGEAAIAAAGAQEPLRLTADDADMVWADDDGESMFHSIDGAVDCIVDLNWPDTTPVEVTFQIAKRLPNASIRIFNITESGHEWEIVAVPDAASNGEQA